MLTSVILILVCLLIGNFSASFLGGKQTLSNNLILGLILIVFSTAIFYTGFKTIFSLFIIPLIYYKISNRKNIRFNFRPRFNFTYLNRTKIRYFIISFLVINLIFIVLASHFNDSHVLHHDFLYYIDVSWHISKCGVEGLITNPLDYSQSFTSSYHYFIPWLLVFTDKLTLGMMNYYDLMLYCVFPGLSFIAYTCFYRLLESFYANKILNYVLAFGIFLSFNLYFPFLKEVSLFKYSEPFNYGVLNSYWSGKILVNLIFLIPTIHYFFTNEYLKVKLFVFLLGIVSIINLPLSIVIILFISIYQTLINKKILFLVYDFTLIASIFLFNKFLFGNNYFVPVPSVFGAITDLFANIRTNVILMIEATLMLCVVFGCLIFWLKIKLERKKLIEFLGLILLVALTSVATWVLFKSTFGSSEFYRLILSTWFNFLLALMFSLLLHQFIVNKKSFLIFALSASLLFLGFKSILTTQVMFQNEKTVNSSNLNDLNLKGEVILSFISDDVNFKNIPGQLNPFVHYGMGILYKNNTKFNIISGSNITSPKFKELLKTKIGNSMLSKDPLFIKKKSSNEFSLKNLILKHKIKYVIISKGYELPNFIEKSNKIVEDETNQLSLYRIKII